MHICEICKRSFNTNQGLVSHLTFPKSTCKINIKDYYDKFIRTSNEGVCKYCGGETNFLGLSKGYPANICGKCNNKNKDSDKNIKRSKSIKETLRKKRLLKEVRLSLIDLLRKQTIDKNNINQCQICGFIFDNHRSLMLHIKVHKIKAKDYYNTYFKTKNEDICLCFGEVTSCKKHTKFISFKDGYSDYCSIKCLSNSPLVYEEKKKNSIKKYGVSHPTKDPDINKRQTEGIHKVWAEKKDVILLNRKKSYLKSFIPKIEEFLAVCDIELIEYNGCQELSIFKCKICDTKYRGMWDYILHGGSRCPVCFPKNTSQPEKEIVNYVKNIYQDDIILNDRTTIKNPNTNHFLEIDVLLPKKNIAIEFNGLYWHSDQRLDDPYYHLIKTEECQKQGIRLIQIFEDEWTLKKNIVKEKIKHILGLNKAIRIHGRKCIVKEIETAKKNMFLENNHIQGKDSSSIKLGAFYNDKLVSVMTFSKGRLSKGKKGKLGIWELSRFASDNNFIIPGIAGKLLTYFKRHYMWKRIYSFADLRWSQGDVYYKLGFDFLYKTKPGYWYIKNYKRIYRFNLRKRPDEPKDVPEWMLRHEQGYFRIWDCGHLKFEMVNPNFKAN